MIKFFKLIIISLFISSLNILPAFAISVSVNIPEEYTDVHSGERIYFQVEVKYPENIGRKDLRVTYQILDGDEIVLESKVLKAIETQASFMDYMSIPESIDNGLYQLNVIISDYEDLNNEVSTSFYITNSRSNELRLYFFVLLGVIALIGGLIAWEVKILTSKRKK